MEWKNLNEKKPAGNERVLVCDSHFHEVRILVYNDFHVGEDCDITIITEDGDDYYCDLDAVTYWMPWPEYKD